MIDLIGGPGRDRTDDLFHAMEARSQLRHRPTLWWDRNHLRLIHSHLVWAAKSTRGAAAAWAARVEFSSERAANARDESVAGAS